MLDVRRLHVLREVARHGSLSAAATALGYTQPAVSRQISVLESEVGVPVLHRLPQGVALTDAGRLLCERAETVLDDLERAEEELRALAGLTGGTLRMAVLASAAASIVPITLTRFRERHPAIELSVIVADPAETLPMIRAGTLDLTVGNMTPIGAVEPRPRPAEGTRSLPLEIVALFDDPMYVAMAPDHPLADEPDLDLADLADGPWMIPTGATCPDAVLFHGACADAGVEPRVAFQYDDYAGVLGFVAAGVGVAVIPDMVARVVRSDVVVRTLAPPLPARPIGAAVVAGHRAPAVDAMLGVLLEVASEWEDGRVRFETGTLVS